ncbi:Crp/Fnr family transcriptional regulator [Flectobacillus sp. BAB-3569]|uniref:Crp/Fnr family transcriptional regulator n=1 Tax=Flectobacillus sp. BAB-3569 TaxID=1509483 RepID=UPI000BA43A71|nr:Crp/Fnr family transcriptional regulator [Flectobacillus sp. BAB-3569]PAC28120.1 Crp/Fnr family transcriptional regulator [Flectobacillus sp. BAB-3569]
MDAKTFLRNHIAEIVEIDEDTFEEVFTFFKPKLVKRKELLIRGGETVLQEYFVVKGCLKTFCHDEHGREHIVQFALESWWVSDFPAHASQARATMCVEALEPCEVLELTYEAREQICRKWHAMEHFFRKKSNAGYVALQKRILSLLQNSAQEKYDLLLTQYPQLFQRVSKTLIAAYLGVSRETLSRLGKHDKHDK